MVEYKNSEKDPAININTGPFIAANKSLPEITFRGLVLSFFLVIILTASNAFLGLKVGMTVAASIPAAVISMGILRFFRNSNILENNIVQTAASAGEALVAGIIFIIPAFVLLGYWQKFNYWQIVLISATGGILGVLFSVPLRRVLLTHKSLKFPEGTAIGHVLMTSADSKKGNLGEMVAGGLVGGLISLAQSGFKVLSEGTTIWLNASSHMLFGVGLGFNPALLAAGYIVGLQVAVSLLVGVILCWFFALPILTHYYTGDFTTTAALAGKIWKEQVRYIGIGVMLTSGLWTLLTLFKPIMSSLRASYTSMQKNLTDARTPRTEHDIPGRFILFGVILTLLPIIFIAHQYADINMLGLSTGYYWFIIVTMAIYTYIAGFVFSSLCGYFSGLVGTTNSPISAMTLGAMIIGSLLLLLLLGLGQDFVLNDNQKMAGAVMIIAICAIVTCASTISNDNIQDLKAGHMVGATPWKQQAMLILGVIISALVAPLILQLLFEAYGIGNVFPRVGMDPNQALSAPQATAMSFVVKAVFTHTLPWGMLITGAIIAIVCILLNAYIQRYNFSLPALGVGMGIYLSLETNTPLIIGGIAAAIINHLAKKRYVKHRITDLEGEAEAHELQQAKHRGLILACGMVAGSTIMGVILAIPFAIARSTEVWRLVSEGFENVATLLSILVTIVLLLWFYYVVCRKKITVS